MATPGPSDEAVPRPPARPPATAERRRGHGLLPAAATAVALSLLPLAVGGSRYLTGVAVLGLITACYGVAMNLIFGTTNQLFLCVGALGGIGAYGTALLTVRGVPAAAAAGVAVTCAAALGALFSWVTVRRGLGVIYVGIVTLTFSLLFLTVLVSRRALTGGETGLVVAYDVGPAGGRGIAAYAVVAATLVAFVGAHGWLLRSHVGWAFAALHDDPAAAALAGVDVTRYTVLAAAAGGAMAATTGALAAAYEGVISPTGFTLATVDVPALVVIALGGVGAPLGPVVGAAVVTAIAEVLRPFAQLRLVVYGVVLLALFTASGRGLVPSLRARRPWGGRSRTP